MLNRLFLVCVIIAVAYRAAIAGPATQAAAREVVFRKSFDEEYELVVVRSEALPVAALSGGLPRSYADSVGSLYSLHAELRSKQAQSPVVLWSTVFGMPKDSQRHELHVLDVRIIEGEMIIVIGAATELWVHRQALTSSLARGRSMANLPAAFWSLKAAPTPINPAQVSVYPAREPEGRWSFRVVERLAGNTKRTKFEQVNDTWEFRATFTEVERAALPAPTSTTAPVERRGSNR